MKRGTVAVARINNDEILYTPAAGFTGTDSFQYEIGDQNEGRSRAWVTVTVANTPPVAVDDSASTPIDESVTVNVTANDWDPDGDTVTLIAQPIVVPPTHGSAARVNNDEILYAPTAGYTGTDTFQYEIGDQNEGRSRAWVTVTVANTPPVAVDDSASTLLDEGVTIHVTANDWDPDGDSVTLISQPIIVPPSNGTATRLNDNEITYAPDAGFSGTDTFQYEIGDGNQHRARAWVDITVSEAPWEPPTLNSMTPDRLFQGITTRVTLRGTNLKNVAVSIPSGPLAPGDPPRAVPTVQQISVSSNGRRLTVDVNCTDTNVLDFYQLLVSNESGEAQIPFRVVPEEPIWDFMTPSEPVQGNTYLLNIIGASLEGAAVSTSDPTVAVVYDVDSTDGEFLTAFLEILDDSPVGQVNIIIEGRGGPPQPLHIPISILALLQFRWVARWLSGRPMEGVEAPAIRPPGLPLLPQGRLLRARAGMT